MKYFGLIVMFFCGTIFSAMAEGPEIPAQNKLPLGAKDLKSFQKTEAFTSFKNICLQEAHRGDPPTEEKLETWRIRYKMEKSEVGEFLSQIVQKRLAEMEKKPDINKEWSESRSIYILSVIGISHYPQDEKRTKALLQRVIAVDKNNANTSLYSYLALYKNCILDDDYIRQMMEKSDDQNSLRFYLCKELMQQYKQETDAKRKQALLDKAFEWAFLDVNLDNFYLLDRFLLAHKEEYVNLPARKVQLEKYLANLKRKNVDKNIWVYRRTEAALENFGKGPEAQKILRNLDENQTN